VAQIASPVATRATWFQARVNQRVADLGRPPLSTAQLDRLYDLWRRTHWAPVVTTIEEVLRPAEAAASAVVHAELDYLQTRGLDAWLVATAVRHGMSASELRDLLDAKLARWSGTGQSPPETEFLAEGMAYAIWQYEGLARHVVTTWGLW
jgi:hypothetical protein